MEYVLRGGRNTNHVLCSPRYSILCATSGYGGSTRVFVYSRTQCMAPLASFHLLHHQHQASRKQPGQQAIGFDAMYAATREGVMLLCTPSCSDNPLVTEASAAGRFDGAMARCYRTLPLNHGKSTKTAASPHARLLAE
jgi:hypothetical protein